MNVWSAEEYLVQRVFPRLVTRWREAARKYTETEISKDPGGLAGMLLFGALMLAFVAIIGGLFWLVSR